MIEYSYQSLRENPDLPTPRGIALEILRLARQPETSIHDVASVIQMDPGLASRLIKAVNAPAMGVGRSVSSIPQAASLLGLRAVMHLALGFCIVGDAREDAPWGYSFQRFWATSLGAATAMRCLTSWIRDYSAEEAFTFGLLSRIGEMGLSCVMKERYSLAMRCVAENDEAAVLRAERQAFGVDHIQLSADLMADWGLPPVVCDAVRAESEGTLIAEPEIAERKRSALGRVLLIAVSVGRVLGQRTVGRDCLKNLIRNAQAAGVDPLEFIELFDAIAEDWRDAGKLFAVTTSSVPSIPELYSQARSARASWKRRPNVPASAAANGNNPSPAAHASA